MNTFINTKLLRSLLLGALWAILSHSPLFSMEEKPSDEAPLVSETMAVCDLTLRENLIPLMAPEFQENEDLINLGLSLFKDKKVRSIDNGKYGQTFPLNPEILKTLAPVFKDKTVFEVAAGPGGNSIFAALCGAKRVYTNDIVAEEMDNLKEKLKSFPTEFKRKFRIIKGDFLKLSPKFIESSGLNNTIDILYARNFLHLLSQDKIPLFFSKLKDLLNPQGQIVVSAHGTWDSEKKEWFSNIFQYTGYFIDEEKNHTLMGREYYLCERTETQAQGNPLEFEKKYPLKLIGNSLVWDREEVDNLSPSQRLFLAQNYKKIESLSLLPFLKSKKGYFTILENFFTFYSPKKLSQVTKDNGFTAKKLFLTTVKEGHILRLRDVEKNILDGRSFTVFAELS